MYMHLPFSPRYVIHAVGSASQFTPLPFIITLQLGLLLSCRNFTPYHHIRIYIYTD
ncbi:uncharacterized protein LAESUDRAFT_725994 [Laetiporus sulphureus 93-53]|uniref:Uncharacterized protein n=1 Tax=Laetiporus sulphureus 93-53 TaxID=1314785 RepID=A0A165E9P3_9APHY|nr:uncharacterized protein LAESUDRAFT_725994 [Laetiporus sulphureus 93-53]KZT06542.1 hypothetical protein LAESUDRAFT_725994 [Laetiporus sulphureus 93-53]